MSSSSPSPYLLLVNSQPLVDENSWCSWYTLEHLPDLVHHSASTRAAFFRETHDFAFAPRKPHRRPFLALYQTEHQDLLQTEEYLGIQTNSTNLHGKNNRCGEYDARNYELIQTFDPDALGEVAPKFILYAQMEPIDADDFDSWYRQEHLIMLHKVPGYRRTLRYKLGPSVPGLTLSEPAKFIAVHELDHLKGLKGPEMRAAYNTAWTQKQLNEARVASIRGFELVKRVGC